MTNLTTNKTADQPPTISDRLTSDSLAQCILSMISAMQADFGHRYTSQYADPEQLRQYKRRLYQKFREFDIGDIVDGYEIYLETQPEWPPTVPKLTQHVKEACAERRKKEETAKEIERMAKAPLATRQINALELLRDAKKEKEGVDNGDKKSWLERKATALQCHESLISASSHLFYRNPVSLEHYCRFPGCQKLGSLTAATKGGEAWFCIEHFRSA